NMSGDSKKNLVVRITEAAVISSAAQEVLTLARSRDASLVEIGNAISKEPSLAAELLRIANSPFFGRSGRIKTLPDALMLIGLNEIYNMASAMAMMAAFSDDDDLLEEFRLKALIAATIARIISKKTKTIDQSTAFTAGLLCYIGSAGCISIDGETYKEILAEAKKSDNYGAEVERLEVERYGMTSRQIGGEMLIRNRLPEELVNAVSAGDDAFNSDADELQRLVQFSRMAASNILECSNISEIHDIKVDYVEMIKTAFGEDADIEQYFDIVIDAFHSGQKYIDGTLKVFNS
ncbi:MAG: HDOD domain-containing protein, partial [Deltaproteobacteria bacterium]|nr:HDOD domain-containing protein [Deltaproteobacteria bacterium]